MDTLCINNTKTKASNKKIRNGSLGNPSKLDSVSQNIFRKRSVFLVFHPPPLFSATANLTAAGTDVFLVWLIGK